MGAGYPFFSLQGMPCVKSDKRTKCGHFDCSVEASSSVVHVPLGPACACVALVLALVMRAHCRLDFSLLFLRCLVLSVWPPTNVFDPASVGARASAWVTVQMFKRGVRTHAAGSTIEAD